MTTTARPSSRRSRFVALSAALTGDDDLSAGLAAAYLKRLDRALPGAVDQLLETFEKGIAANEDADAVVRTRVAANDDDWALAREIITLWFTARLPTADRVAPEAVAPEQYFQALLWPTVRAHPPGLSGGYFGHWHYEPEN